MKRGLVLEGGAMRGLFTAGVLDVLALYKALVTRHVWYNEAREYIDSRVAAGAAVLIAPKEPLEISRVCHDPDMMQRVYDIGREAGESALTRGCFCGYNMPHEKR